LTLLAHTDACARPRASVSLCFRSDARSSPVAVSPGWRSAFHSVISANLSSDAWPLSLVVRAVHVLVSSHAASAFPMTSVGRHVAHVPIQRLLCRRVFSGLQAILYVQASEFARHPDRSDREIVLLPQAAMAFTSTYISVCHLPEQWICSPSESSN